MNAIEYAYINALLADATYALNSEKIDGFTDRELLGFLSERMTEK